MKRKRKKKADEDEEEIEIIPRESWGASPPRGLATPLYSPMKLPINRTVFTYNLGVECCHSREACLAAMVELQRHYMHDLGFDDIPYNFLIGEDGVAYEGRGWYCRPDTRLQKKKYHRDGRRLDVAYIAKYKDMPFHRFVTAHDLVAYGIKRNIVREDYSFSHIKRNKIL